MQSAHKCVALAGDAPVQVRHGEVKCKKNFNNKKFGVKINVQQQQEKQLPHKCCTTNVRILYATNAFPATRQIESTTTTATTKWVIMKSKRSDTHKACASSALKSPGELQQLLQKFVGPRARCSEAAAADCCKLHADTFDGDYSIA